MSATLGWGHRTDSLRDTIRGWQASNAFDLIDRHARADPGAMAVMAPGMLPLDYGGLVVQVAATVRSLRAMGIRPRDPVAVVLSNGPELATALLGVMAAATCAPLNPSLRA